MRQAVWVVFTLIGLPGVWLAWQVRKSDAEQHSKEERAGVAGEDEEERVELMPRGGDYPGS